MEIRTEAAWAISGWKVGLGDYYNNARYGRITAGVTVPRSHAVELVQALIEPGGNRTWAPPGQPVLRHSSSTAADLGRLDRRWHRYTDQFGAVKLENQQPVLPRIRAGGGTRKKGIGGLSWQAGTASPDAAQSRWGGALPQPINARTRMYRMRKQRRQRLPLQKESFSLRRSDVR